MADTILTPVSLWQDFDDGLPLKEVKLNSYSIQSANITNVYFSGRQTKKGRVRIFGTYAVPTVESKGSILIIPDACDTVDGEMVIYLVNLGYNVLCIDYRGEYLDTPDFTKYPDDVDYANYLKRGNTFDYVEKTAKETCWYEWTSVARYGVSYLKEKHPNSKIAIMGNKYGANICWQLAATDKRVDASIFLFGAGWQAYNKIFKQSDDEIEYNEERCRFLAGIDAQAYAQYVECPVLYLSTTNNDVFDAERAVDTLSRVKNPSSCYFNFITTSTNVLDSHCLKDVELFLSKYILSKKEFIPKTPLIDIDVDDEDVVYTLKIDHIKETESIYLMASSNDVNPTTRVWYNVFDRVEEKGGKLVYKKHIYGESKFEMAFVAVKYNNGFTISSNIAYKWTETTSTSNVPGVIFSSTKLPTSFIIEDIKVHLLGNVFAVDSYYSNSLGPNDIKGVESNATLTSYLIKNLASNITEESFVKFDIYTPIDNKISVILKKQSGVEFNCVLSLKGGEFWQNYTLNFVDFKDINGIPLKKFSDIESVSIKSQATFMINNFILI